MRRRIKLIVSTISLALSIALAMFGVYAAEAAARQTAISGTISFTTNNVRGTVFVFEYFGAEPENLTAFLAGENVNEEAIADYFVAEQEFNPGQQGGLDVTLGTSNAIGGTGGTIPMDDDHLVYTFIVRIINDNTTSPIYVNLTDAPTGSGSAITLASSGSATTVAVGTPQDWKYTFTVNPAYVNDSSISLNITPTFELKNTPFN